MPSQGKSRVNVWNGTQKILKTNTALMLLRYVESYFNLLACWVGNT